MRQYLSQKAMIHQMQQQQHKQKTFAENAHKRAF